jgi:hypothetical protein
MIFFFFAFYQKSTIILILKFASPIIGKYQISNKKKHSHLFTGALYFFSVVTPSRVLQELKAKNSAQYHLLVLS